MGALIILLIWFAVVFFTIAGMWKSFQKAGEPGWAAIIPIYNVYVILKIAGKPAWWLILFLIPVVNFVVTIIAFIAFAEKFGKGAGYGLGLTFLGFVFWPMLGFGDDQYVEREPMPIY